ncbi:hypothetical protein U9M48_001098 [Paspalum notatum var. saurae]|uniref:Uncharacterized protein n=1 Tax=Paspalum notatum var. saurae TaxID=547442 RepID=A0AAQ3PFI1_PASNO
MAPPSILSARDRILLDHLSLGFSHLRSRPAPARRHRSQEPSAAGPYARPCSVAGRLPHLNSRRCPPLHRPGCRGQLVSYAAPLYGWLTRLLGGVQGGVVPLVLERAAAADLCKAKEKTREAEQRRTRAGWLIGGAHLSGRI